MPFSATPRDPLQHHLDLVITLLEKHKVVEALVHKQESPRQVLVEQLGPHAAQVYTSVDTGRDAPLPDAAAADFVTDDLPVFLAGIADALLR